MAPYSVLLHQSSSSTPFFFSFKWKPVVIYILVLSAVCPARTAASTVESLPGFGPLPFRLETGYIGVDERDEVQLFYYFVESERNPSNDPLVLWLTGGPGCSGISGLIYEIGPLRFNKIEYNGTLPSLTISPFSWTKVSSVIFIDAPVGTGFSYSKTLEGSWTGDRIHAHQCYIFLRKWLLNHPGFIGNPVYIAGDSYSGMIVPLVAQEILDARENPEDGQLINLKGYILGNPGTESSFDDNSKVPFAHRMALIPDELFKTVKRSCRGDYVTQNGRHPLCSKDIRVISKLIERVKDAHILEPKCKTFELSTTGLDKDRRSLLEKHEGIPIPVREIPKFHCREYFDLLCNIWVNDRHVQEALHVQQGVLDLWARCNRKRLAYVHDVPSTVNVHRDLHSRGCRALIYSGDHDMMIPYLGTLSWIKSLNLTVVGRWRPWLVDNQVAGFVTEYAGDFTFATVKGGGHTAPEYLPKECYAMYTRWISGEPL